MDLAYIRVSSAGQHTDRQLADLQLPPEQTYIDHCSGNNQERPELQNMLRHLREGDIVHVHSLDRLARNLKDLMALLDKMTEKRVEVRFHKENLTFAADRSNPMNRLLLQIFGALAEWERALIRERQAEGFEAARRKGKRLGRPTSVAEEQKERVRETFRKDMLYNVARLSRETGVPESSCRVIRKKMQAAESLG